MIQQAIHQPQNRKLLLTEIYTNMFPAVAAFIAKKGGTLNDAQDVFQDAVLAWYEQKYRAKSVQPYNDKAYIMAIVKNKWSRNYAHTVSFDEQSIEIPDEKEERPAEKRLMNYLVKAGRKCMDLLQSFYYEQQPMQEIARNFGFSGVHSATVQKYKCLQKVREIVKEKSLQYEDFME